MLYGWSLVESVERLGTVPKKLIRVDGRSRKPLVVDNIASPDADNSAELYSYVSKC